VTESLGRDVAQPQPRLDAHGIEATSTSGHDHTFRRNSLLVLFSTVVVGIGNYGLSLALVWFLGARQFSIVSSISALLLVVGTTVSACFQWVVARQVARFPRESFARREAVSFSLLAAVVAGLAAAIVVVLVASTYAGPGVLAEIGLTTFCLFIASVGSGFLQGEKRFVLFASGAVIEVLLKLGIGTGLAASGFGATGAVAGSAVGAVMWAILALVVIRKDLRKPTWKVDPELWQQLAGIGTIQIMVSIATTLDVIVGSVVDGSSRHLAGYQAMLVFARIPLFTSTAISAVAYPRLVVAGRERDRLIGETASLYMLVSAISVAVAATIPERLLRVVLPSGYAANEHLLLPLTIAGFGAGLLNLATTFFQAEGIFRWPLRTLGVAIPIMIAVDIFAAPAVANLAWATAIFEISLGTVMLLFGMSHFSDSGLGVRVLKPGVLMAALCVVLRLLSPNVALWLTSSLVVAGVALGAARWGSELRAHAGSR